MSARSADVQAAENFFAWASAHAAHADAVNMRTTSERDTPPRHGARGAEFYRVFHGAKAFVVIETRDEGHALIEITLRFQRSTGDRTRVRADACKQRRRRFAFRLVRRPGGECACGENDYPHKNTGVAEEVFHFGVEVLANDRRAAQPSAGFLLAQATSVQPSSNSRLWN